MHAAAVAAFAVAAGLCRYTAGAAELRDDYT